MSFQETLDGVLACPRCGRNYGIIATGCWRPDDHAHLHCKKCGWSWTNDEMTFDIIEDECEKRRDGKLPPIVFEKVEGSRDFNDWWKDQRHEQGRDASVGDEGSAKAGARGHDPHLSRVQ